MKTVLITGANRGLGLGFCHVLSSLGYKVFAGVRDIAEFTANSERIVPIQLNILNDDSIKQAADQIASTGHLDLLVNNAGLNKDTATSNRKKLVTELRHLDRQALLSMFDTNAVSPLMIIKYVLPLMSTDPSYIINISSDRASFKNENTSGNYGYRTSKVALNMFTCSLLHDLPANVRTFAVHPGSVNTDMNPGGLLTPEQAASKVIAILDNWSEDKNGAFLNNEGNFFPL